MFSLYILNNSLSWDIQFSNVFLPVHVLSFDLFSKARKFLILTQYNLYIFSFIAYAFRVLRNNCLTQNHEDLLLRLPFFLVLF